MRARGRSWGHGCEDFVFVSAKESVCVGPFRCKRRPWSQSWGHGYEDFAFVVGESV